MSRVSWFLILGVAGLFTLASSARGQAVPNIGYVYPAGGQQGTTFQVKLGGQRIDGISGAIVSGDGVSAKLLHYYPKIGPQEITLLREQLREIKRTPGKTDAATKELVARIQKRMAQYVNRPASASLANIAIVEVTVSPNASPGQREFRIVTSHGASNPLVFHIGQLPETTRKPMITSAFQVLGKEALALRHRPADEVEDGITVPCTMNGQIASGEVNRYRFDARKGQQLVISVNARQLIPYIADAVPGWFQPVLTLCDDKGKEVAFDDDYRFNPDPTLRYVVPKDGQYVLTITDALYRGREDFVYRITIGEVPFVTSIFPLGCRVGTRASIKMDGWNLQDATLAPPPKNAQAGVYQLCAKRDRLCSNTMPFALDTLPECMETQANDDIANAEKVALPVIINGRVDRPGDWDVFQVQGRAGQTLVAEVDARRLASPLDSVLEITDQTGKVLAVNDDHEDAGSGLNTHHADSYLMFKLPADGAYFVRIGDTARHGGREYAYRLRLSPPRPDFELRAVPSAVSMRRKGAAALQVYAIRKDGFTGNIKLGLKDPPSGFSSPNIVLPADKQMVRLPIRTTLAGTQEPVNLTVQGRAMVGKQEIVHDAVPAEDRMQAFLWRHLVPAEDLKVTVFNPAYEPQPTRPLPPAPPKKETTVAAADPAEKPKFTKRQVGGQLRRLRSLYEQWLLNDDFYNRKVAECESAL